MPSKTSKKKLAEALRCIPKELLDQMISSPKDTEAVNTASMAFKKARPKFRKVRKKATNQQACRSISKLFWQFFAIGGG